jgi:hypothetical protein
MIGTLLNIVTVLIGGSLGLLVGDRLNAQTQKHVMIALGLVTVFVGLENAALTGNIIIPLISLAFGVIIGDWLDIHGQLENFAGWLQTRLGSETAESSTSATLLSPRERFIQGFVTASLVFCVGPLTVIGSIQDGMTGDYELLAIKATLDGFAALAFAASLGVGVLFTVITILVVQGGLALVGYWVGQIFSEVMINEVTATGGLLLLGLSLILLDIQRPKMANYLPALLIAPLIVVVGNALGVDVYPDFGS